MADKRDAQLEAMQNPTVTSLDTILAPLKRIYNFMAGDEEAQMAAVRDPYGSRHGETEDPWEIGLSTLGMMDPAGTALEEAARASGVNPLIGMAADIGGTPSLADLKYAPRAAGFFASMVPSKDLPAQVQKIIDKPTRDAAARWLKGQRGPGGLLERGTPSSDVLRGLVRDPKPTGGMKLSDIPLEEGGGAGHIALRETKGGPLLENPLIEVPSEIYSPEGLERVVGHEFGHGAEATILDKLSKAVQRSKTGGAPLTEKEKAGIAYINRFRESAITNPWRPEGHSIREALEGAGRSVQDVPHGSGEQLADVFADYGAPGFEGRMSQEAKDIMEKWTTRDPWTAQTPGSLEDIPMVEEQLRALRR